MGSECPRELVSVGSWNHELRLHVRHDFQARALECSQAIGVENQVFFKLLWQQWLKTRQLDLVVQVILQLLLVARHVGFPAFDLRLEFQKRESSRRNDRTQKVSFSSSCRRIIWLLQSPPCLQWILSRVGMSAVCICPRSHPSARTRDQLLSSWFPLAVQWPLQHRLGLLDRFSEECLRLLRPLLEILLTSSEFLRTTKTFHTNETRGILPDLIVDCSHCIGKSTFCCHLSSESEQLLLKLCHNLLQLLLLRMRFRKCSSCVSPHTSSSSNHGPANEVHQRTRHQSRAPTASFPPHKPRIEQRSLCFRAQQITKSVNQRCATMMK